MKKIKIERDFGSSSIKEYRRMKGKHMQAKEPTLFLSLKHDAYINIWNSIMDKIELAEAKGLRSVSVRNFPRYTLRSFFDELLEAGYDVTMDLGEYSSNVTLHIVWDELLDTVTS